MNNASAAARTPLSVAERRVAMADVDGAQIIYFTSPHRWMEAQFTTLLADLGHPLVDLLDAGVGMPVVATSAEYHRPLRLDDVVVQEMFVTAVGSASFTIECVISRADDDGPAVTVTAVHVWSTRRAGGRGRFASTPIPDWLRSVLATALESTKEKT